MRLILIDSTDLPRRGHSRGYTLALLDAANQAGHGVGLVVGRDFTNGLSDSWQILPRLSRDCYGRTAQNSPADVRWLVGVDRALQRRRHTAGRMGRALALFSRRAVVWYSRSRFGWELYSALRTLGVGPRDVVFMHTIDHHLTGGWAKAALLLGDRLPRVVLLFRHDIFEPSPDGSARLLSFGDRLVAWQRKLRARSQGRIHFATDSRRLANDYRAATNLPFAALPVVARAPRRQEPAPPCGVFRFLYVGPDRPEKGLDLLCKAIARLPAQLHATHPHFILQIQSEVPTSGLLAPGGPTVEIVGAELRRSQYEDLMLSCHAIVLPYQPWHYRARTSSVFVEAVMANRLVIVPADTWMADQLKELEGGGVEFAPYTAGSLAEALSEAIRDYGRLVDCPGREAWCSRNSAESLVAELLLLAENDQGLQLERGPYAA